MIDWTKPLELMDGTPMILDPTALHNPDLITGNYHLILENWQTLDGDRLIVRPDGTRWSGLRHVVIVRNRPAEPEPLASVNTMAKVEGWSTAFTKTLRDEFAMAALTGLLANAEAVNADNWSYRTGTLTGDAFMFADNMLAARDQ